MKRLFLALAVVLTPALPAAAQTASLSGTVVDQSGGVVPGATVLLTSPGIRLSAVSGSRGEYRFTALAPGTYQITVTLVGFSQATRSGIVVANTDIEIPSLELRVAGLVDVVVVSASRVESTVIDAPATMTVLQGEQLNTAAENHAALLRAVPGVNVIQMSARDVSLTSRQATLTVPTSQLVLVDGRSIVLDFFGLIMWDFVPSNLSDVKQIEVVRGPASAVWGTNALTGVVNVVTKRPREAPGTTVTMNGGAFARNAGSTVGKGPGGIFGTNATVARAPNDRWAYRLSAGYFASDPLPRPTGQIPVIVDPRDPTLTVGGAMYPIDGRGPEGSAFQNTGTSQPKLDVQVDQEIAGGRVTYAGGVAGTSGIIHTGIGPFDIQPGSYLGYGKVNYHRGGLKVNAFVNFVDAQAPNLLINDPTTGLPLDLGFATQTYDLELGYSAAIAGRHLLSVGGNVRRNNFEMTIAPTAKDRNEIGAYIQDEIIFERVRFNAGGRLDKFGNISSPVFSPRLTATFKATPSQAIRVSYNKAFRSPSMLNNYEEVHIAVPADLSGLAAILPPPLQELVAAPFPLVVRLVGSEVPIGATPRRPLTEESLTAYEVAYTGAFRRDTTLTAAWYVNDQHDSITFSQLPGNLDPYTSANPPPGWVLPPIVLDGMAAMGIFLPRTAFTYLNLGPLRQKGLEVSVDHRINDRLSGFANYSWQAKPVVLSDPRPYPTEEISLPPTHRVNVGFNLDGTRFLGSGSVNYVDQAFWSDVLSSPYHGVTDAYTIVNGRFGVKWSRGKIVTLVRITNLFNADVQQHVFGDLITRSGVAEIRLTY
jgi:outer membrane receptor protein involved in Fe transport